MASMPDASVLLTGFPPCPFVFLRSLSLPPSRSLFPFSLPQLPPQLGCGVADPLDRLCKVLTDHHAGNVAVPVAFEDARCEPLAHMDASPMRQTDEGRQMPALGAA